MNDAGIAIIMGITQRGRNSDAMMKCNEPDSLLES